MLLSHERRGSGDPLLLIHGTGSYLRVWDPVVERLARERDVIAVDLPGFGSSPALSAEGRSGARELAGAVAELMGQLGLDSAHVAGNSLGGWIALELAKRGRARSVTGLSPAGFWTAAEAAWCRVSLRNAIRGLAALRPVLPLLNRSAFLRRTMNAQLVHRGDRVPPDVLLAAQLNLLDSPGTLPTIDTGLAERFFGGDEVTVPVTIAWGEHDHLLFPRQAKAAAAELPGARIVTLPGCGHVPMLDDPEAVARVLLEGSAG
jgi:pimeloyl-ACP methyl ester carboxylesterase